MVEEQPEEEIILADLSDEDLTAQMHDDLYDGLADEIAEGTNILLARGWEPGRLLNDALVEGMRIVGIDFRDGILFPRRHPLCPRGASLGQRHESRHGHLAPPAGRNRRGTDWQSRYRYRQGRHPRYWEKLGGHDARRCRLRSY